MKRIYKNIISIIVLVALIGGNYATLQYFHSSSKASMPEMSENGNAPGNNSDSNTPPEKPSGDSSNDDTQKSDGDTNEPPEKPSGDTSNDDTQKSDGDTNEPPEKPSGDTSNNDTQKSDGDTNEPPEKPDGESSEAPSSDEGSTKQMHENGQPGNMSKGLSILQIAILAVEGLCIGLVIMYLILSKFNALTYAQTFSSFDKVLIFILAAVLIAGGITGGDYFGYKYLTGKTEQISEPAETEASGATTVSEDTTLNGTYTSTTADESAILVTGGTATIENATVKKTGDSSNTENSEFNGVNAGILVQKGAEANITNTTITTDASGSNAVFATGEKALITIKDSTITTTGSSSARGLDATYGGTINAENVKITTQGGSCATLATDRGEGTVTCDNGTLTTNGSGSPIIYSTGDITVTNTTGTANKSQCVVIEGKNSATVNKSTLTCSANGNRGDTDVCGVMIYQSMSGDAGEGTGTFTAKNSTLTISSSSSYYKSAPMFFITNTSAVINLTNTKLSFGSDLLLSIKGTDQWGTSGSNGGTVELNAKNQVLTGDIEIDKISTLEMNLTNSSYQGTINKDNTAKSINLVLSKDSTITLTGNSYVTSLEDGDSTYSNINFNGYKLYVNGKSIS